MEEQHGDAIKDALDKMAGRLADISRMIGIQNRNNVIPEPPIGAVVLIHCDPEYGNVYHVAHRSDSYNNNSDIYHWTTTYAGEPQSWNEVCMYIGKGTAWLMRSHKIISRNLASDDD